MKVESTSRAIIVISTLLSSVASTCPAQAAFRDELRSQTVRFVRLDLDAREGKTLLFQRVRTAARIVCSDVDASRSPLRRKSLFQTCVNEAIQTAVAQVDHVGFREYASARMDRRQALISTASK
jgi:UrcA family protein